MLIDKDPNDTKPVSINYKLWLRNETISSSEWVVPEGITETKTQLSGAKATIWLAGGSACTKYLITNRITSSLGRVKDKSFTIVIKEN